MGEQPRVSEPAAGMHPAFARWRVFPPLALGVVMATLDASIVNIALPTIGRAFGVPLATAEWFVLAYTLTITGLVLALARTADAIGRRRMYATGLIVFMGGSLACGLAPGASWLIAARVAQGVGAAMVSSITGALLTSHFPDHERGRALGAFGATVGLGLAIGPPLGGLIVQHASWRWIFLINLPLGLLTLRMLLTRVPVDPPTSSVARPGLGEALPWSLALLAVMFALSRGPVAGWSQPLVSGALLTSGLALGWWALASWRSPAPLLPLHALLGPLGVATTLTLVSQALTVSVGYALPHYFEDVLGFAPQRSGLWLAMLPLAALLCAPLAGALADRLGTRPLAVTGMALTALGLGAISRIAATLDPLPLLAGMALVGVGQGLFAIPNASALLASVPREHLGLASGLQSTMRNLGLASGVAVITALVDATYRARTGMAVASGAVDRLVFAHATGHAFLVMAVVAAVATLLALVQPAAVAPRAS